MSENELKAYDFPNGMTVADLKYLIRDWPKNNEFGEPCEVWLCDSNGISNQARMLTPLNVQVSADRRTASADLMLSHDA